jgi:hypothetical protein
MWKKVNAYSLMLGKPRGKKPLGRPKRRWVHNSKVDIEQIEWGGVYWTCLTQGIDMWRELL